MTRDVLIAGAGVGGLEAALALRAMAPGRVNVRMLAPSRHFIYRPLSTGEPFGHARTMQVELAHIAEDRGFELIRDALDGVDTDLHEVITQDGERISYDTLVLSLGARAAIAVPGALAFRGPRDVLRVREGLDALVELEEPRIVFAAGGGTTWTLPLYELALMSADWAARRGLAAEVMIITAESSPLEAFGPEASGDVGRVLADHGITVRTGATPGWVEDDRLWIPGEGSVPADLIVALPFLRGPATPGLPADADGFVPVDEFCRVRGVDDVFAVGDMSTHPLKQGGLAAQQADVAARAIAAAAGEPVAVEPYEPILRGLLLTGGEPLFLRNPPADDPYGPSGDGDRIAPWWPPHKIVGAHLAPYLATHAHMMVPAGVS